MPNYDGYKIKFYIEFQPDVAELLEYLNGKRELPKGVTRIVMYVFLFNFQ